MLKILRVNVDVSMFDQMCWLPSVEAGYESDEILEKGEGRGGLGFCFVKKSNFGVWQVSIGILNLV
jgi:hypothetical protein